MRLTFTDTKETWSRMLPLTYTRPVADLRVGILRIHEKWSACLGADSIAFRTKDYLKSKFEAPSDRTLTINANILPTPDLVAKAQKLEDHQVLVSGEELIAGFFDPEEEFTTGEKEVILIENVDSVIYPWDIFRVNGEQIRLDYELLTKNRKSLPITDPHTVTYGDQIFIEEGAKVKAAILNAENGPIYIGKDAEVQEGALIRGPFALCEHSVVNMGAKIKGDSTVGPYSKVGGEISNSVLQGYSNKGHDGFLGNSVIGEWCNLGADTNTSNLKNNYAGVKMWDFNDSKFKDTGLQFCGLIMGDHSKCGINTMFNTGTTIGISSNIFGDGFPRNFIPSFSWGGAQGFSTYPTRKVFETARIVMQRRGIELSPEDESILTAIFDLSAEFRVWEKKK
ncbi:MAG: GlmU family protein [Cyclobacteriaceae bacterium]